MRLIDADALIDEMKKWYWDKEKQRAAELDNSPMDLFTNLAIVTVKEQPTAYDRANVIDEITERFFDEIEDILHQADLNISLQQSLTIYARIMNKCNKIAEQLKGQNENNT